MVFPGRTGRIVHAVGRGLIVALFLTPCAGADGDPLVLAIPADTDLVSGTRDADLLAKVIADATGSEVETRMVGSSAHVAQELGRGSIDIGIVANTVVRSRIDRFTPIANFTRGDTFPFRFQIVVASSGGPDRIQDLIGLRPVIALDVDRPDRRWFLVETFGDSQAPGGGRVVTPRASLEALRGVASGRFDAACVEENLMTTFSRFSRGEFNQLRVLSSSRPTASDLVAGRKDLDGKTIAAIRQALLSLENQATGQQVLISLRITRFVEPVSNREFYPSKPVARPVSPSAAVPTSTPESRPTPQPTPPPEPTAVPTLVPEPEAPEISTATPSSAQQPEVLRELAEPSPAPSPTEAPATSSPPDERSGFSILPIGLGAILLSVVVGLIVFLGKRKNRPGPGGIEGHGAGKVAPPAEGEPFEPDTDHGVAVHHSDEESDLVGDLRSFGVSDLLQLIASARHTGTLEIESRGGERAIHFENGEICGASCLRPDSKNNLCAVMYRMGMISESDVEVTRRLCRERPGATVREAFEELGLATTEEIVRASERQAKEIVYTILLSPEGRFRFVKGERPPCVEGVRLPVTDLIMEGARRADEWERIRAVVPDLSLIPKLTVGFSVNPMPLDDEERHLIACIDGRRNIDAVALAARRFDFDTVRVLAGLIGKGAVELGG